ncbi:NAD-dependent epimerase/dehydratase family protein [Plantactinospora soyae]|uniref:Nucleoside-diphosphate-sugar epimerase n=1 Tax=Plantactinospora soyae TaxID=1544732 RepID=A0A927QZF3_9ACTN|nr:NAD-dependent epimerase/dehydratase family protein [Plantactinospora soyae]MBE1487543.1 nucleoside-diphosphate-sugar epimerase [Plantactinospora soyae]
MLVLVTGGTGFLGSHSVAEILRAGHRVRLLVRDPAGVVPALDPLGVDVDGLELFRGDVTDADAVAAAMRGCDAVLHAASVYSFDSRARAAMRAVNVRGTELVLDAAGVAGLDPIVYVSSFAALLPTDREPLGTESPVGTPRETYMSTKARAEAVARRAQRAGAPVVITYPLATLGPHDPKLGDQAGRVRNALRGLMPMWPSGGFPVGDVRDVARLHAAVLNPGRGPRRFLAQGRYVSTREFVRTLRRVTGRRLPAVHLPASGMLPVGALTSLVQRLVPAHIPAEYGAIYTCLVGRAVDTTATDQLLGSAGTTFETTLRDTVRWLHRAGHISDRLAGATAVLEAT